ncbi:hypothetical protein NCCP2331_25820 [Sporosarcina sp. NCCP-2331]|nr:hypothetical protein NCCP2331_25820 [Sporosarcina sp. NCCP-2331]
MDGLPDVVYAQIGLTMKKCTLYRVYTLPDYSVYIESIETYFVSRKMRPLRVQSEFQTL